MQYGSSRNYPSPIVSLTGRLFNCILKLFCPSPPLFQKLDLNLHELKGDFTVLETEGQDFYIINWKNTFENLDNHLFVFGKIALCFNKAF